MSDVSLHSMRQMQRWFDGQYSKLIDWDRFSLDAAVATVATRVQARIHLHPFHWENRAYTGLTLGWTARDGKTFLVIYEQEATDEHRLVIILHELMHILLDHCSARLTPQQLRRVLQELNLLSDAAPSITYVRQCLPGVRSLIAYSDSEEVAAELGAIWIVTRARQAGSLPAPGQLFTPEQVSISKLLGSFEEE